MSFTFWQRAKGIIFGGHLPQYSKQVFAMKNEILRCRRPPRELNLLFKLRGHCRTVGLCTQFAKKNCESTIEIVLSNYRNIWKPINIIKHKKGLSHKGPTLNVHGGGEKIRVILKYLCQALFVLHSNWNFVSDNCRAMCSNQISGTNE